MSFNMNYSGLFSGWGSSSSGSGSLYSLLGEYNNIRTGTYKRVLKQYYGTQKTTSSDSKKTDNSKKSVNEQLQEIKNGTASQAYSSVKSKAAKLKETTAALTETGTKSLFAEKEKKVKDEKTGEETTVKAVDTNAIHSAVKNFVSAYNDTLKAANESGNAGITRNAGYMTNQSKIFSRALQEVGITINKDNTLSVDEDKLKNAKTENLQKLFNGSNSYANYISQRADMVSSAATNAATSKNFYGSTGSYQGYGTTSSYMDWLL